MTGFSLFASAAGDRGDTSVLTANVMTHIFRSNPTLALSCFLIFISPLS